MTDIIARVNKNTSGIYKREPELVTKLPQNIADIVGDDEVNISEFIMAKIKGKIRGFKNHLEITDKIFREIPSELCRPDEILRDVRSKRVKYLFIKIKPKQQIVIEIKRPESGKTEINTIFQMSHKEQRRLEQTLPTAYKAPLGDAPTSPYMPRI